MKLLLPCFAAIFLATCSQPEGLDVDETLSYGGASVSYGKVNGRRGVHVGVDAKQVVRTLRNPSR